ncbi:MAG: nucleotidyltransferase family protein [Alphaproteobacteria bacterium]|nr:nucleotidyltransferase family protein [Alphaproteobacteria bacterium]MBU2379345.1 nucleotidyltransferase family protein [Alphaproteobacteria bacterium]
MSTRIGRHALVLAAGASRRFGGGKLVAPWRGEPLVRSSVRSALATNVERVTVVTGADDERIAEALAPLRQTRLKIIHAEDWSEGMAASLRAGIAALPADAGAVAIFLGDMPLIPEGLADRLLDATEGGAPAAAIRSPHGPAHPVVFHHSVFGQLLTLRGDTGARVLLKSLGADVFYIESADPGAVFDIDHPNELTAGQPLD